VTNVGVRPTFQSDDEEARGELDALVETHLIDQDLDLYGRTVEVRFEDHIRSERKFSGVDELKAQISKT
jgi:riboflavin kinase/FMN adenylyltransferase